MTRYLVQVWDRANRRWDSGGSDIVDCLFAAEAAAQQAARDMATEWDCPASELRVVPVNDTEELERLTGVRPLVDNPKYEALFR